MNKKQDGKKDEEKDKEKVRTSVMPSDIVYTDVNEGYGLILTGILTDTQKSETSRRLAQELLDIAT